MSSNVHDLIEQLSKLNPFSGQDNLPDPPRPSEKSILDDRPIVERVALIQQQLDLLCYNHLPHTFFNLEKHRSLQSVLSTAREIMIESLPIRCLEATFVGLLLTQGMKDVNRFPLSFKSTVNGKYYRHIVLLLQTRSPPYRYGAVGLSRKPTLMYKPLHFTSIYDIVMDYRRAYETLGHQLVDIKLGLYVTHDSFSRTNPCWRFVAIKMDPQFLTDAGSTASPSSIFVVPELDTTTSEVPCGQAPHSPHPGSLNESRASSHEGPLHVRTHPVLLGPSHECSSPKAVPTITFSVALDSLDDSSGGSPRDPLEVGTATTESPSDLARFLRKYSRLLPLISEQYYKNAISAGAAPRAVRLCFFDLDEAGRDAGLENRRRILLIKKLQSPLSAPARKEASQRQLPTAQDRVSRVACLSKSGSKRCKRSPNLKKGMHGTVMSTLTPSNSLPLSRGHDASTAAASSLPVDDSAGLASCLSNSHTSAQERCETFILDGDSVSQPTKVFRNEDELSPLCS